MKSNIKILISIIIISHLPILWLFTEAEMFGGIIEASGNIFGILGMLMLTWNIILNNRFLISLFTKDIASALKIHKYIGIISAFFIFLHPFLLISRYSFSLILPTFPFQNVFEIYVMLGRFALFLYLLIWVSSAILREKMKFRPWKFIHFLTYPTIIFVLLHAENIGSLISFSPVVKLYYNTSVIFMVIALIVKVIDLLSLRSKKYTVISNTRVCKDLFILKIKPINKSIKSPRIGQYIFLKYKNFGEAHPFSIMRFDKNSGEIEIGIKSLGKYSNKLMGLKENQVVLIDGPYGSFTIEGQNNNPKVIIAGGIGITPFVQLIEEFPDNTFLFYSNRECEEIINRNKFRSLLDNRYFEILTKENVGDSQIINKRIDEKLIDSKIPDEIKNEANYFICGSPRFIEASIGYLKKIGIEKRNIFREDFGF